MKNFTLKLLSISTLLLFLASPLVSATSNGIGVAAAYDKGNSKYDVVVKEAPGTQLVMYVNDKTAYKAKVNKSHWATFHKVKLTDKAKLSFTKVVNSNHSTYQKPINYVRYATLLSNKVAFIAALPKAQPTTASTRVTSTPTPASQTATPPANTGVNDTNLSNNNTYTNSAGTTVHSPADSTDGQVPAGATAQCMDGTYSFSQTHRGTCSHHGGVATWL